MTQSRKICLSIGVSKTDVTSLAVLDGAITAAESMGEWARKSGFGDANVRVLTDRGDSRVTKDIIRQAVTDLLPDDGTLTDLFVLSFAGHGYRKGADATYWLLSDSDAEGYAVAVEDFKRRLFKYGIHHLTIFSDACRSFNDASVDELDPISVVRPRRIVLEEPGLDRFNACQDGTPTYMVSEGPGKPGKCIFSGMVEEALWGRNPAALRGDVVDSNALGLFVKKRAREIEEQYGLSLTPSGVPALEPIVYFDRNQPPALPHPDLMPWPQSTFMADAQGGGLLDSLVTSVLQGGPARRDVLGIDFGAAHPGIDSAKTIPSLPKLASAAIKAVAVANEVLTGLKSGLQKRKKAQWQLDINRSRLEEIVARESANQRAGEMSQKFAEISKPANREGANLIIAGGTISQIWADGSVAGTAVHGLQTNFRVGRATQMMIAFDDDLYAPVTIFPNLTCTVMRHHTELKAVVYGDGFGNADPLDLQMIGKMDVGHLSASDIDEIAAKLRRDKHGNPTMGVMAAYLYDVIGDIDSIRRMAYFYTLMNQPIPYDIAFMGMIRTERSPDGQLLAHVDPVPERTKRHDGREPLPDWVTRSTPAADGRVAGRCPWLKQGWDHAASPEEVELPMVEGLAPVRRNLKSSNFTLLDAQGGLDLIRLWGLGAQL